MMEGTHPSPRRLSLGPPSRALSLSPISWSRLVSERKVLQHRKNIELSMMWAPQLLESGFVSRKMGFIHTKGAQRMWRVGGEKGMKGHSDSRAIHFLTLQNQLLWGRVERELLRLVIQLQSSTSKPAVLGSAVWTHTPMPAAPCQHPPIAVLAVSISALLFSL